MPRCCFLLLTFSLSLSLSSAFRWRCHADDAEVLHEVLGGFNMTFDGDCCRLSHIVSCNFNTSLVEGFTIKIYTFNGTIPPSIGKLTRAIYLTIHKMPQLHGGFPLSMANLTNLRSLSITWTNLTGPIPSWIGGLTNLESLDLSFNELAGSIPPSIAELTKLTVLRLDRNHLTGQIPESFGRFRGSIPDTTLSYNLLSGAIPKSLGDVDWNSIDLQRNMLVGDPSYLFNNRSKRLNYINLSRNFLSFNLTGVVFPLNLGNIDLSHNMVYGSIPPTIEDVNNLQGFNVSYNKLCGKIPQSGSLAKFDSSCYMHNRCLCGPPLSTPC